MSPDPATALENADADGLRRLVMDAFHRIIFHYGAWFAQVEHQLGMEDALKIEGAVWKASLKNQMGRLGKTLGFEVEPDGTPSALQAMDAPALRDLLEKVSVNWLANDGIWFQAVEGDRGMFDAKRCNDTCWSRFSPFEAARIKELLGLPEKGGLEALKTALGYRLYAVINEQSIVDEGDDSFVFQMNNCRVQAARKRKNLPDYPCKSAGMVEYPWFAKTIDPRIQTECVGCPPDHHPEEWFCAWRFTRSP